MRRAFVAASLLLAVLSSVAATASGHSQDADKGCNVRLKGLKTLSDPQRKLVNLHPKEHHCRGDRSLTQRPRHARRTSVAGSGG